MTITDFPTAVRRMFITPDEARALLGSNVHNRRVRLALVSKYAIDMINGRWRFTGEPIKIAKDGTLLDGQHRLMAVVEAGIPVEFLVVSGLDFEAQENMDSGSGRTLADALALRGESRAQEIGSISRLLSSWGPHGINQSAMRETPRGALLDFCSENIEELRNAADAAVRHYDSRRGITKSTIGLLWIVFSRIDPEDAEFFFARIKDGTGLEEGDGIYVLRRWLENSREVAGRNSNASTTNMTCAVTIKAWNAWRNGMKIGVVRWRAGGSNPEPFPVPE